MGGTLRSPIQPVELARKLRKEMDDHKTISVSQIYVPNIYTVYLSPADREQFVTYEASLRTELGSFLFDHARQEQYTLPGRVRVLIETDESLDPSTFGIAVAIEEESRFAPEQPEEEDDDGLPPGVEVPEFADPIDRLPPEDRGSGPVSQTPPAPADVPAVGGLRSAEEVLAAAPAASVPPPPVIPDPPPLAVVEEETGDDTGDAVGGYALTWPGGRILLGEHGTVLVGRSRTCDIVLDDGNVSRKHAELVRVDDAYEVRDLGSTNGTLVNGQRVRSARLSPGDTVTFGTTTIRFDRSAP